jgi:hypothetical protein
VNGGVVISGFGLRFDALGATPRTINVINDGTVTATDAGAAALVAMRIIGNGGAVSYGGRATSPSWSRETPPMGFRSPTLAQAISRSAIPAS